MRMHHMCDNSPFGLSSYYILHIRGIPTVKEFTIENADNVIIESKICSLYMRPVH